MELSTRVTGPAPVAQVWERYAVPAAWPGWAPQILGVEATAARIAVGVTGRVRGPLGVRVAFLVTAVDEEARTWAWRVRVGPVRLHLRHGVRPDPAGTTTWLAVRGPAPLVVAYLPVARLALRRLVGRRAMGRRAGGSRQGRRGGRRATARWPWPRPG